MRSLSFLVPAALAALAAPIAAQASWSQLYPSTSPAPRAGASMACFEPTGDVVLTSGMAFSSPVPQFWKLQGSAWTPLATPGPNGHNRGLVYDAARQRLVLFGGYTTSMTDQTWEWNGTTWSNPAPAVRPSARIAFGMAFDRARGVTVLFGGIDSNSTYLADLWEWNGQAWSLRATSTPLGARAYTPLAFDPSHRNVLAYGGMKQVPGGSLAFNDSWSWNGTAWQQHLPAVPPPYVVYTTLASDLHRKRVVMYGGIPEDGVWREWDGTSWTQFVLASPGSRRDHAFAYDPVQRRTVTFGGSSIPGVGGLVGDTWVYRTSSPADVVPFGSGCAGTVGTPALANAPYEYPWLGDTMRTGVDAIPAGEPGAVFVSSFGTTPPLSLALVGAPGCDLLVPVDVAELRAAAAGRAEWALAIPNAPALAGVVFRQQAFVFDAAANALGLVASNGITLTTGIR